MEKKVIVITGTNSGFGWLAARTCAALGHNVYATMRDTEGRNADKAKILLQLANIEVMDVDVTNGKSVIDAIAAIIKKENRIDVVVNNAESLPPELPKHLRIMIWIRSWMWM